MDTTANGDRSPTLGRRVLLAGGTVVALAGIVAAIVGTRLAGAPADGASGDRAIVAGKAAERGAGVDDGAGSAVPRPIDWARVAAADGAGERHLSGLVRAAERAPLSFETDGRVRRLAVDVGDRFAAGDTLAELDDSALVLLVEERRAALAEAEAGAADARRDARRSRELYAQEVESIASLQDAEAAAAAASGRLELARALIRSAEERLADARLVAPYDGVVTRHPVEAAQLVRAGETVLEVQGESGGFEIEVDVPDTVLERLDRDALHAATLGGGGRSSVSVRVTDVGSRAEVGGAFPVTFAIEPGEGTRSVRAGTVAELALVLRADARVAAGTVAVPLASLSPGQGRRRFVFVHDAAAGVLRRREVAFVDFEGDRALIGEGLAVGETVATRGVALLADGMPVTLRGVGVARYDL